MGRRRRRQTTYPAAAFTDIRHKCGIMRPDALEPERGLKVDRRGHGEPGADVARPLELVEAQPRRAAELVAFVEPAAIVLPAPAYLQRHQPILAAPANVEESGS